MASIFHRGKSKTWWIKYYVGRKQGYRLASIHIHANILEDVTVSMIEAFIARRIREEGISSVGHLPSHAAQGIA